MSDLRVPNWFDDFARMRKDVDDLLRRAPQFDTPDAPPGCCARYCCLDTTGYTLTTGQIRNTCVFDPDPVGGVGVRVKVDGWVRYIIVSASPTAFVTWVDIDAAAYDGAPRHDEGAPSANDVRTIPFGATIDVDVPDPTITIRHQNLGASSIQIVQVYATLEILPIEGSSACGHAHVGTGPL